MTKLQQGLHDAQQGLHAVHGAGSLVTGVVVLVIAAVAVLAVKRLRGGGGGRVVYTSGAAQVARSPWPAVIAIVGGILAFGYAYDRNTPAAKAVRAVAPSPSPSPSPVPTVTQTVTQAVGAAHPFLTGGQFLALAGIIAAIILGGLCLYFSRGRLA